MIEMLCVLLLEIILIACIGCHYTPANHDNNQLAIELAKAADKIGPTVCTDLIFPPEIERMYRTHEIALCDVDANLPDTPFVATMRDISRKNLQVLFQEALPEIANMCARPEVSQALQNVCRQAQEKAQFNSRMQSWFILIKKLAHVQSCMRSDQLAHLWFPSNPDASSGRAFILKNKHLVLDNVYKKYLMADTVITFLPFALMARHDPDIFAVTLRHILAT